MRKQNRAKEKSHGNPAKIKSEVKRVLKSSIVPSTSNISDTLYASNNPSAQNNSSARYISHAHNFEKIMMALFVIVAVSYGILSAGNNLSILKSSGSSASGTNDNQMTAMAVTELQSITGKTTTNSNPAKPVVVRQQTLTNGLIYKEYQDATGKLTYNIVDSMDVEFAKGNIGDFGVIENPSSSSSPPQFDNQGFTDLQTKSKKTAKENKENYNTAEEKIDESIKEKGLIFYLNKPDGSYTLLSNNDPTNQKNTKPYYSYEVSPDRSVIVSNKDNFDTSTIGKIKIVPSTGFFGETKYQKGDDSSGWTDTTATDAMNILGQTKNEFKDTNNNVKKALEIKSDVYALIKLKNGGFDNYATRQQRLKDWNALAVNTRGKLSAILNAYMNDWLGKYTQGIPAAVCGDSLYKKDSSETEKKKIAGVPVPSASYGSQQEKDILENIKTVIIEGEKTQVSDTIFRYAVTWKLIGDKSEEWKIWLHNSCTEESSYDIAIKTDGAKGWYNYGTLSSQQFFGLHEAFQLECNEKGKGCKYDKACITFLPSGATASAEDGTVLSLDITNSYCINLIYGQGFEANNKC